MTLTPSEAGAAPAEPHRYRSWGAANGCARCIDMRSVLHTDALTLLAAVETVDYGRSADEVAAVVGGSPYRRAAPVTVGRLEALAAMGMIERRVASRVVPPGPDYVAFVRCDGSDPHWSHCV